jgi:hypothetical protein
MEGEDGGTALLPTEGRAFTLVTSPGPDVTTCYGNTARE